MILYSIIQLQFGRTAPTSTSDGSGMFVLLIIGILAIIAVAIIMYKTQKKEEAKMSNPQVNLNFCPHCGSKNQQNTPYCSNCGQLIKPEA